MLAFKKTVSGLAILATLASASLSSAETFQEALISVYNSNPRLQAERARVREVDENYVQARAQGRLTANASGSYGYTAAKTPSSSNPFSGTTGGSVNGHPHSAQLQIIQPIYQGGRVKALKKQAKSSILAAREGLRNAEQSIFLSAANAYVDVVRDEETARIRRNNVMVLARQQLAAKDRFDVGEGTRTDIAQAQSRQAAAESGLAQAEAQLQSSRASYTRIIGHPPVALERVPQFELPRSLQVAIALARENNPQLLAAYFNEEAAGSAIDVAKSASRPVLSLNGTASTSYDQVLGIGEADQASLTAQLTIPIFTGGLNQSRVRQAKHAKTRLAFEVRDTELAVDQTVAQIWAQLDAARLSLRASRQQVTAAEVAFEGVDLEQKVGTRTTLDVLDAEQEVLNAKLSVVEAERNVNAATFQLLTTLGVFDTEGINLQVEAYDPTQNFDTVRYQGMTAVVDRYVPEFVQDVADEIIEIPGDLGEAAVNLVKPTGIVKAVETIGETAVGLPRDAVYGAKTGIDRLTGDKPDYSPQEDVSLPEAETQERRELPEPSVVKDLDPGIISEKERPDLISPQN
ncbi:MAG: TolC family outer membrane protein [Hellea sp.]